MDGIEDLIDVHELVMDAAVGLPAPLTVGGEPLPLVVGDSERMRQDVQLRLRTLTAAPSAVPGSATHRVLLVSGEVLPAYPDTLWVRLALGTRTESFLARVAGAVPLN